MHLECRKYKPRISLSYCGGVLINGSNPSRFIPGPRKKINLNFYFHTSLWCLKRFLEGLEGLHKTIRGNTKKFENKNLS